jgi:Avidin family
MSHEKALRRALAGTGPMVDFSGQWKNELSSQMNLIQTIGSLVGTYESAVSGGGAKTVGDLVGFVDGDLISFVVHWRDFQAITSWVGQGEPGSSNNSLKTLWQMTKQVSVGEEWASINAGSDFFTRI